MTAFSTFNTLEAISLADGKPENFTILYSTRANGRSFHLVVNENEMALALGSGNLPPVYGFEEADGDLIPLDQEGTDQVIQARRRNEEEFGYGINPTVTMRFPGDQSHVQFEEEFVAPFDAGNSSGGIVALCNVTDDLDIRVVACQVDSSGKKVYEPLPEAFATEALEIASYLSCKRRLLRGLN